MESISKKTGKVFKGKIAEVMVKIGVAYKVEEPVEELEPMESIVEPIESAEQSETLEPVKKKRTYNKKK